MNDLELPGLEPDNLLAFLALLGLLRALEAAQPDWHARVVWGGPPWSPRLCTEGAVTQAAVVSGAQHGLQRLAPLYDFGGRPDINWKVDEFRAYAATVLDAGKREPAALLAALASDFSNRKGGPGKADSVTATALCTLSGAGHQHFLGQLATLKILAGKSDTGQVIAGTLFASWQYVRNEDALRFRWDPAEDRRYAYRYGDPKEDRPIPVVPGANLLAALGFALFPVIPGLSGAATIAFGRVGRDRFVAWPIWNVSLSLTGIRALLAHPEIVQSTPDPAKLRPYGVIEVMQARRLQVD